MLNNQQQTIPVLIQDLGRLCPSETSKQKTRFGIYKCSCGNEFKAIIANVKSGATNSCGCYKKGRSGNHGLYKHKLYKKWQDMLQRTTNKNCKDFKYYGGRGIKVCDRWKDVKNFIEDMYPTHKQGLTIDRINNDGNYEPSNCRWANRNTQVQNTRKIRSNNTSGYRGVCWDKSKNKWECCIGINGKNKRLGYFDNPLEAAKAYDKYVIDNGLEHTVNGVLS